MKIVPLASVTQTAEDAINKALPGTAEEGMIITPGNDNVFIHFNLFSLSYLTM